MPGFFRFIDAKFFNKVVFILQIFSRQILLEVRNAFPQM